MNMRKNEGITLIVLVITVILLLIISGISITGTMREKTDTEDIVQFSELSMVQHAILERYTKSQLTKESLPGMLLDNLELNLIIEEIENEAGGNIDLKGGKYFELSKFDLENLGITDEDDVFIVNYNTGEVINKTQKITKSGRVLYISL